MSNRISICFLAAFAVFFISTATAQDKPIKLSNPSFGGSPKIGDRNKLFRVKGWQDCGFPGQTPPDIQPNLDPFSEAPFFGVTQKAYHDSTYLGLVVREDETFEAVGQRLRRPLEKGKCYEFSMHLSRSATYTSPNFRGDTMNYTKPVIIRVWGGSGYCGKRELLAETGLVKNAIWKKYNMRFEPTERHSFIMIQAHYKVPSMFPYNGNVLVDNLSDIVPVPCDKLPEEPTEEEVLASVDDFPIGNVNKKPTRPEEPAPKKQSEAEDNGVAEYSYTPPPKANNPRSKASGPKTLQGVEHRKLRKGQIIQINRLYFDVDDSTINSGSFEVLDEIYEFMQEHKGLIVEIRGHTNGNCDTEFCNKLSLERAKAVADYLTGKGIDDTRLGYKGYGKRKPIASNRYAAGRKKNRRVEIKIISLEG